MSNVESFKLRNGITVTMEVTDRDDGNSDIQLTFSGGTKEEIEAARGAMEEIIRDEIGLIPSGRNGLSVN